VAVVVPAAAAGVLRAVIKMLAAVIPQDRAVMAEQVVLILLPITALVEVAAVQAALVRMARTTQAAMVGRVQIILPLSEQQSVLAVGSAAEVVAVNEAEITHSAELGHKAVAVREAVQQARPE